MDEKLAFLFAVAAMFCWGISDFVLALAIKKAGTFRAFFWNQLIISLGFLALMLYMHPNRDFELWIWVLLAIDGILAVASFASFCKALEVGPIAIVSPISACWGALVVVGGIFVLGETPTALQIAGVLVAVFGAVLASFHPHDLMKFKLHVPLEGAKYAFIAMLMWCLFYLILGVTIPRIGAMTSLIIVNTFALIVLVAYKLIRNERIDIKQNTAAPLIVAGLLGFIAYIFYGMGDELGLTSIVAPVTSIYPVITVLLAWLFLKEKLEINQWIGVALSLIGLTMIAI